MRNPNCFYRHEDKISLQLEHADHAFHHRLCAPDCCKPTGRWLRSAAVFRAAGAQAELLPTHRSFLLQSHGWLGTVDVTGLPWLRTTITLRSAGASASSATAEGSGY